MGEPGQSLWKLASTTALIGMGVVFTALFLLSVYMHYFKVLVGKVEGRHRAQQARPPKAKAKAAAAPSRTPAPAASPSAPRGDAAGEIAAAVALGLHLRGVGGAPSGDVAAAIASVLAVHRARLRAAAAPQQSSAAWPMSGRLAMMEGRVRRQAR